MEQYAHTLIAIPKSIQPTPAQVQSFVNALLALPLVSGTPTVVLRQVVGTREGLNPFTGQMESFPRKASRSLTANAIAEALMGLADYELEVSGQATPTFAPISSLPDAPENYAVTMTVHVSKELRSTSDTYNGFEPPLIEVPFYGSLATTEGTTGYFSNPFERSVIEVPEAGVARFWIEFELGKFLFPRLKNNLRLLDPRIVAAAETAFEMAFAQGCHWIP